MCGSITRGESQKFLRKKMDGEGRGVIGAPRGSWSIVYAVEPHQ